MRTVFLIALGLSLFLGTTSRAAELRRDFVRKPLAFFELTVPTGKPKPFRAALTVFEMYEREAESVAISTSGSERHLLKQHLLSIVEQWFQGRLNSDAAGGVVTPHFARTFSTAHSMWFGRGTILVLSDPDDFGKILALQRIAKPSATHSKLPIHRQFGERLKPFPELSYRRVPDNNIRIYSYRNPEPHLVHIENAVVYSHDTVEVKHAGAVFHREVDLTALLFHAGQELAAYAVSRLEYSGRDMGLEEHGPVLIVPARFVAESDNPLVLGPLKEFGLMTHQTFESEIHPDREAEVMLGSAQAFGYGFYHWNLTSRRSWQLRDVSLVPNENPEFLRALLGADRCSEMLLAALREFEAHAQEKLALARQLAKKR